MHYNDGFGVGCYLGFDIFRIYCWLFQRNNISKNRSSTNIADSIGCGYKSKGRDNYFIACCNAQNYKCQMKGYSAVCQAYCMGCA